MFKLLLLLFFLSISSFIGAQTLGGNSIFNFLKLPNSPQLTGLGGINLSNLSNDIGLSFNNPALLRQAMHAQVSTVFNAMYAGIKNYHVMAGYRHQALETNFSLGLHYLDYGNLPQTDPAGNVLGNFRPGDYVIQVAGSRTYLSKWYYGATLKYISSNYGLYHSNGIALDAGVAYYDSSRLFQASLVMKNMGIQIKRYDGTQADGLPFDLEIGLTRRLSKAPIQFSITAHHLHQFNLFYNDTTFNNENGYNQGNKRNSQVFKKIFSHFIVASQFFVDDKIEITAAYNHLRRNELNLYNTTNGFNGFSLGVGILFRKLEIRYARAYYQNNTAYNQFGLNIMLNEYTRSRTGSFSK
ncbi:MAG: type IX secretion system protein PorQ [Chitinophagaceae bacterium]